MADNTLSSRLTHDLRNPLAAVKMALQLMERTPEAARLSRQLDMAMREIRATERILCALAELPAPVSEGPERVDLADCLATAARDCGEELRLRRVALEGAGVAPGLFVEGDRVRFARALFQLLAEAGRAHPAQTLVVTARRTEAPGIEMTIAPGPIPAERVSFPIEFTQTVLAEMGGRLSLEPERVRMLLREAR